MNQAMNGKRKPGGCTSVADVVFEFQNATLINNWLHEADERQEELPSLWTTDRSNATLNPGLDICGQFSNQLSAGQQSR